MVRIVVGRVRGRRKAQLPPVTVQNRTPCRVVIGVRAYWVGMNDNRISRASGGVDQIHLDSVDLGPIVHISVEQVERGPSAVRILLVRVAVRIVGERMSVAEVEHSGVVPFLSRVAEVWPVADSLLPVK